MILRYWPSLGVLALLGGCAAATSQRVPQTATAPTPAFSARGLEAVMGQDTAALVKLFGRPGLDVHEGAGRKLQFTGAACILDAYLYPKGSGEAVVTYIDARQPDGRDIDRASCIAALMAD